MSGDNNLTKQMRRGKTDKATSRTSIVAVTVQLLITGHALAGDGESTLERGRDLYTQQCADCHGDDGESTGRTEGVKTLPGIQIRVSDFDIGHRFRGFFATLISEEDQAAVVDYVKTLKGKKGYERPEHIINPTALDPFVTDPMVRIVDLRSEEAYQRSHIPNAVNLPAGMIDPVPDGDSFFLMMEDIGIGKDTYVVTYDDNEGRSASLLWAILRHYGHPRVSVLDGGWSNWLGEGRYTTVWKPAVRAVTFSPRPLKRVFVSATAGAESQIVPVSNTPLATDGKTSVSWWDNLAADDTLLPARELGSLYGDLGLSPYGHITAVSNDSGAAALVMLGLNLIGYQRVSISRESPAH